MALVVADQGFPPGLALLHAVDQDAEAWVPTYLAEHGSLPTQGGWTAATGKQDGTSPASPYVVTAAVRSGGTGA